MPNYKRIIKRTITAVLLAVSFSYNLRALEVPELKGRVNDYANMLSPGTISELNTKLEQLENTDSTQIVVVTIPSLEGDALEDFSIRLAEKWGIGQKGTDNGAVLLISKNDRKIRIEVGYGLEGTLTDLMSGRIIDNIITPNFREGNFDAGVTQAVDAMISIVRGEYTAEDLPAKKPKSSSPGIPVFLFIFLFFLLGSIGRMSKIFGGILGGILVPILGLLFLPMSLFLLLLIPIGFLGGLIFPLFMIGSGPRHGGGFFAGGGGFGSGGFGGGFSGGGGGFGGGGASGGW